MFTVFSLVVLSSNKYHKNEVRNTCEFNTIRFNREDVNCLDMGQHVSYCNNRNLPQEFVVTKELGIGNKEIITIKPEAMWEEVDNTRFKMANFQYNFYCDNQDNEPQLMLNILPTTRYDISLKSQVIGTIVMLVLGFLLIFIISAICPCVLDDDDDDSFCGGLLLGVLISNLTGGDNRRTYCD